MAMTYLSKHTFNRVFQAFVLLVLIFPLQVHILYASEKNTQISQPGLVLVENSQARAFIIIPDNADSWTRMAAGWVADYVEKVSSGKLARCHSGP